MTIDPGSLLAGGGGLLLGAAALVTAVSTKKDTKQINNAVNHRKTGELTLVQMVSETNDKVDLVDSKLDRHLGWHEGRGDG